MWEENKVRRPLRKNHEYKEMTFEEFERKIHSISSCQNWAVLKTNDLVYVNKLPLGTFVVIISETMEKALQVSFDHLSLVHEDERNQLLDACLAYACTPIKNRKKAREYYLRVKPEYQYLLGDKDQYLNVNNGNGGLFLDNKGAVGDIQTKFTEEEIEYMSHVYSFGIFDKVEVDDEDIS